MAKAWFETNFGKSKTISPPPYTTNFTGDTTVTDYYFNQTFQITPTWSNAEVSTYLSTNPIVVVPINPIVFLDDLDQQYVLVFFIDALNQINAKLQVYDVMPQYKEANFLYDVNTFSGVVYQICLDGKVQRVLGVENGDFKYEMEFEANSSLERSQAISRSPCVNACRGQRPTFVDYVVCFFCTAFRNESGRRNAIDLNFPINRTYLGFGPAGNFGNQGGGGTRIGNQINNTIFTVAQLLQVQKVFRDNGLFDLYETLQSNQSELRLVYNFLKTNSTNQANITLFKRYLDKGFSYPEFDKVRKNPSLFTKSEAFFNTFGSRSDFNQRVLAAMTPDYNPTGLEITEEERVKRYEAFIDITNDFKTQLTQQTDVSITSNGDMNLLMRIFGKVLGKKIGLAIPFVGTALGAEAAWSAYAAGDLWGAAFELAGIAMDFIPAGFTVQAGWTVVSVAYDAFKAYKPISKISGYCTGAFADIFAGLFRTIDELNLIDKLDDITASNSITNISVNVSAAGKTAQDFLDKLASSLGKTWDVHPSGAGLKMELGGNSNLFFYTRTSTGNPGIQVTFNGVKVFKIDFM